MKNLYEAVCCCGHTKRFHIWVNDSGYEKTGKCAAPGFSDGNSCPCKTFTDKRISKRRAVSKQTREAGPKAEILKLLEARGIPHYRMLSGDIVVQVGARRRRIVGNKAGTPDILAFFRESLISLPWVSRALWIECKSKDGSLSDEQQEFCEKVGTEGHRYLVARSAHDVEVWLNANGV
jgi:hypothetical protein